MPKEHSFQSTESGSSHKDIYKLDSKENVLVKVGEMDLQEYINSFYADTNYKKIIEDLHLSNDNFERIAEIFPQKPQAQFLDVSEVKLEILENIELANNFYQAVEYEDLKRKEEAKKEALKGEVNETED